jgi:hypothetical protein
MGFFSWFFESSVSDVESTEDTPPTNFDGTPMITGTHIDIEGKLFGQCSLEDTSTDDIFRSTSADMFESPCDMGLDDSFT